MELTTKDNFIEHLKASVRERGVRLNADPTMAEILDSYFSQGGSLRDRVASIEYGVSSAGRCRLKMRLNDSGAWEITEAL